MGIGKRLPLLALAICSLATASCQSPVVAPVEGADWKLYGLESSEQRYSPLKQINSDTIARLGLAWSMDLPPQARSMQGTPLAIGGKLYFSTSLSKLYAVDAKTGKLIWEYDPEVGNVNGGRIPGQRGGVKAGQ